MFSIRESLLRIKKYFKENLWAPFIFGFEIILLVCAVLLIFGNSVWANGIAVAAYLSLVIGVILQLVSFLRHGQRGQEYNE